MMVVNEKLKKINGNQSIKKNRSIDKNLRNRVVEERWRILWSQQRTLVSLTFWNQKFRFIYLGKGQNYEVENSDKFEVVFGKNSQGKTIIREINWIKSKGGVEFKQSDITPGDQILGKGIIIST